MPRHHDLLVVIGKASLARISASEINEIRSQSSSDDPSSIRNVCRPLTLKHTDDFNQNHALFHPKAEHRMPSRFFAFTPALLRLSLLFIPICWLQCCFCCELPPTEPRCSYEPANKTASTMELKRCLTSSFDKLCPPSGSSNVTEVSVIVLPINLIHVDDKAQQLSLHVYFAIRWTDKRLAWNSSETPNKTLDTGKPYKQWLNQHLMYFEPESLWLPHIIIRERLYTTQESYFLKEINLRSRPDGVVTMYGYFVDKWACRMSTRLFPFDYQRCNLTLVTSQQVNLTYIDLYAKAKGDATLFDSYINAGYDMGEWTLDIRASRNISHQWSRYVPQWECTFFIYEIGLSRDPMQHVLTWIIPPVITSLGAVLGLYLGCDPSERYSFGSAIVIALILMMIGLNDRLPVSDDGFPVLGMLYFSLCIIVIVASFLSTIPSKLRRRLMISVTNGRERTRPHSLVVAYLLRGNNLDIALMTVSLSMEISIIVSSVTQWAEAGRNR